MPEGPTVRVRRATPAEEDEVARFEEAFDHDVLPDETRRFLRDERHHLLLGYVDDRPAGSFRRSRSSTLTSDPSSS